MCGIMGYTGDENAAEIIIDGLEKLEYRGYDSAGIAVSGDEETLTVKVVGSPSKLWEKSSSVIGRTGVGHTRWATHGAATEQNAHPHMSESGMFCVVHNGIIENYEILKKDLIEQGVIFSSETDTEVIAHLLEKKYNGDLKGTVGNVIQKLSGSFALGIICRDYPDTIVCTKKSSPLFIGVSDDCGFVSSDISAISERSTRIFRLNDYEIGMLRKDSFKVTIRTDAE